jgi:hypothetical protein
MELAEFKNKLGDNVYNALVSLVRIVFSANKLGGYFTRLRPNQTIAEKLPDLVVLKKNIEEFQGIIADISPAGELKDIGDIVKFVDLSGIIKTIDDLQSKIKSNDIEGSKLYGELLAVYGQRITAELRGEVKVLEVNYDELIPNSDSVDIAGEQVLRPRETLNPRDEMVKMLSLIDEKKIDEAFNKALTIERYCKNNSRVEEIKQEEETSSIDSFEVFNSFFGAFNINNYHHLIEAGGTENDIKLAYSIIEKITEYNDFN